MLSILGCALPDVCDKSLEDYCKTGMEHLAVRLDIKQIRHLDKFARTGKTLGMRAARILARLMLFSHVSGSSRLCTDENGLPFLENKNLAVGFSYTHNASFCALFAGNGPCRRPGLDAESWGNQTGNVFASLAEMKSWLKLEAILKARGTGLAGAKKDPKTGLLVADVQLAAWRWKYLAFPGHIVCIAANAEEELKPELRWLQAARLL